ncbi:LTA synthase family protein [Pedobacter jeongneungensis]
MKQIFMKSRYSLLYSFIFFFICVSTMLRISFTAVSLGKAGLGFGEILTAFAKGFVFDLGVSTYFSVFYALYLLILPQKWNRTGFNKVFTHILLFLMVLISIFSFFAEFTFWREFESRFNFIAVDYLVYTYEVVHNINESYPLPLLISAVVIISFLWNYLMKGAFRKSFESATPFARRSVNTALIILTAIFYTIEIDNSWGDKSGNRYAAEISKAGIYSFVAAFKANELSYDQFYPMLANQLAFNLVRKELTSPTSRFIFKGPSVRRSVLAGNGQREPNVIMVVMESFSADYMGTFGNTQKLTPVLDSLAKESILFERMYATGTRTVRGMEALSLAVPPTPGNSIVRRSNNANLSTIGSIFSKRGYSTGFFYGGDGYFDNMNQFFGSNGYDITDRGRKLTMGDAYLGKRTILTDSEVSFENAWGVSDGDLFAAVIRDADKRHSLKTPFYDFVMTTSNHRPFTYPKGKIDIPPGTGREGAVKYTDYAIGEFLRQVRKKPWFSNTVFIFVADHCAESAGKNEIDISRYHIPAMIYNLNGQPPSIIPSLCSQIDLYPTLFGLLKWDFESNNFGMDVRSPGYRPRILLGTYQKLGYLRSDTLVVLSPRKPPQSYLYDFKTNIQTSEKSSETLGREAISYYQSAYYLFRTGGLKK